MFGVLATSVCWLAVLGLAVLIWAPRGSADVPAADGIDKEWWRP